jgi:hypothetical protein
MVNSFLSLRTCEGAPVKPERPERAFNNQFTLEVELQRELQKTRIANVQRLSERAA